MNPVTSYTSFEALDIRVGTILKVVVFEKAKKPAYQLTIDFGPLGIKKSSAQITELYQAESLVGKKIIAIVNFEPKQIANFMSECLVLGVLSESGVVLLKPDGEVKDGDKIA